MGSVKTSAAEKSQRKILEGAQKSCARRSIPVRVAATGHQQQRRTTKRLDGLDCKSQPLPFPAGSNEENAKCAFRNLEALAGLLTRDSRNARPDSIWHDVDLLPLEIVPMNDLLSNHP